MEFKQPTRHRRPAPIPQRVAPSPVPVTHPQAPTPPTQPKKTTNLKKSVVILTVLILAIASIVTCLLLLGGQNKNPAASSQIIEDPGYATLLPQGSSIKALGGWERISPPDSEPVFAFADKIGKVSISVSQQPIPASLNSDANQQVAQLAQAYSATNTIDAEGTTVYIGTSANGPQSVIFTKKDLLVLIKSTEKIDNAAWIRYIISLR